MSEESKAGREPEASGAPGWVVPVAAAVVVGAFLGAYFFGLLSDRTVALVLASGFALLLAGIAVKAGFESAKPAVRYGTLAAGVLMVAIAMYPTKIELLPGTPVAEGSVSVADQAVTLPSAGAYRLLVSSHLRPGSGESSIEYQLRADEKVLAGRLERRIMQRAVRRGPAMAVAQEHEVDAHDISVSGDSPRVKLDFVRGNAGEPVVIRAFKVVPAAVLYAVMALLLAFAAALESRIVTSRNAVAMSAAAAACFGILIRTADPSSSLGAVLGSALLAAGGGAVIGTLVGWAGRKALGPKVEGEGADSDDEGSERAGGKPNGRRTRAA